MKSTGIALVVLASLAACDSEPYRPTADKLPVPTTRVDEQPMPEKARAPEEKPMPEEKLGVEWKGPDPAKWSVAWSNCLKATEGASEDRDGWVLERTEEGVYTAMRKFKEAAVRMGEKLDDAGVLTSVKTNLAANEGLRSLAINVDVEEGVVTLKGTVETSGQAGEAVRIALGTPGVEKVVSHLTWNK